MSGPFDPADGTLREFSYEQSDLAILDASEEAININWTSRIGPIEFIHIIDRLPRNNETTRALVGLGHKLRRLQVSTVQRLIIKDPSAFDSTCDFIRLDLTETESVAWQHLTQPDILADIVGYGQNPSQLRTTGPPYWLDDFIQQTATYYVSVKKQDILDEAKKLADDWRTAQ